MLASPVPSPPPGWKVSSGGIAPRVSVPCPTDSLSSTGAWAASRSNTEIALLFPGANTSVASSFMVWNVDWTVSTGGSL